MLLQRDPESSARSVKCAIFHYKLEKKVLTNFWEELAKRYIDLIVDDFL